MFNTTSCILLQSACEFTFSKIKTLAIISFVKEWKKARTKYSYTENYIIKKATLHIATNQTLEMILQFVLVFRCVYCVPKNLKSISSV